jgi:hypothetical protein
MCNPCYSKRWRGINSVRVKIYNKLVETRFDRSKRKAKIRKIDWSLSLEEFKTFYNKPCFYCANKIGNIVSQASGLDRVNNNIGYQFDNVVSCCEACNLIRNVTLSSEEMKQVAQLIISLRSKIIQG